MKHDGKSRQHEQCVQEMEPGTKILRGPGESASPAACTLRDHRYGRRVMADRFNPGTILIANGAVCSILAERDMGVWYLQHIYAGTPQGLCWYAAQNRTKHNEPLLAMAATVS